MKEIVEKILAEELNKFKFSKTDREIILENFEVWWEDHTEDYKEEHHREPSIKDTKTFIKKFVKDNANINKPKRQAQKESEQIDCIINVLKHNKQHLSIKEMSDLLIRNGFKKGASVQNLYKWLPEELSKNFVEKDSDGKYFYDSISADQRKITQAIAQTELSELQKKELILIISRFLDSIKDSPGYE